MPLTQAPNLTPVVISNTSDRVQAAIFNRLIGSVPSSQAGMVSTMIAYPYTVPSQCTVYKAWWVNGSVLTTTNAEVGIYSERFEKIVTTGSVALSGASLPQVADLTDTTLAPGLHWIVLASNNNAANRLFGWPQATGGPASFRMFNLWQQGSVTLGSLPATATPAAFAGAVMYIYGLITRSNYDL